MRRARAGSRSTRRATPSSSPFRPHQGRLLRRLRFTEALASGPIQVRVGLHTGTPLLTEEGYVGGDVHRAARIAAAGHGGQVLVSSVDGAARRDRAARPRRAPAQGPHCSRAHLSARRGRLPRAQEPVPHEPAGASDTLPRTRAGALRGRRAPRCRRRAPPHPDRAGWHGEDATRAAGGWPGLRRLPRRRVVDPARAAARPGARPRDRGADARLQERPRRAHRGQVDALPVRQLRAGGGGGARARGARERMSQPRCAGDEPRASPGRRRADLPRAPARRKRRRGALPDARPCGRSCLRPDRGGARALPAPRRAPPRARARRRPHGASSAPSSSSRGSPSASTCSRASATPIPASRPCERRSSGRTTSSPRTSSASSPASPSLLAAAPTRQPRRSPEPTRTPCSRSSTRASCASATPRPALATGCSRRSASTRPSGSRRRARRTSSASAMPTSSSRWRRRPSPSSREAPGRGWIAWRRTTTTFEPSSTGSNPPAEPRRLSSSPAPSTASGTCAAISRRVVTALSVCWLASRPGTRLEYGRSMALRSWLRARAIRRPPRREPKRPATSHTSSAMSGARPMRCTCSAWLLPSARTGLARSPSSRRASTYSVGSATTTTCSSRWTASRGCCVCWATANAALGSTRRRLPAPGPAETRRLSPCSSGSSQASRPRRDGPTRRSRCSGRRSS